MGAPAMTTRVAPAPGWIARTRQRAFRHAPEDAGGVVLRHSRIYVLPTRRGLAVMATLFTMLLTSLNYALSLGFVVTFLFAGLVGAALLQTFRNLAGIEIRPAAAGESFLGTPVAFTLALAGHGSERAAIALRASRSESATVDVHADGQTPVTLQVTAVGRGRVPLGRVTVSTLFPLGLWRAWAYVHFPLAGLAYPAPELGAPPVPVSHPGTDGGAGAGNDDADLAGLREYQVGDPLQRVAWKAVARGGGWFTKQFEGANGDTCVIDWNATPGLLGREARLSRLCAWVLASGRAMRPYSVRLPGVTLPAASGREHQRSALAALALFEADA
jgi:uncharacterized protein (DUF58 family)